MRLLVMIAIFVANAVWAQDTLPVKRFEVRGYVKDLQSLNFMENFKDPFLGNLIHNRLNSKWSPSEKFSIAMELRNRLFWGDEMKNTPNFSSLLRNANEAIDLSVNWIDKRDVLLNTNVDRLWAQYNGEKWNARFGRQRINWGIGTTWNPNDLFNTYNFLDFDYEERPGADALKLQYETGPLSNIEAAVSLGGRKNTLIAAAKYLVNKSGYDVQLIAGWFYQQPTFGVGWSGSLQQTGFKGEVQYFYPRRNLPQQVNISAELNRLFEKGWYANVGVCINSRGLTTSPETWQLSAANFSPQNLMPTKWNALLSVSKEITPLFVATSTMIYAPGPDLLIIFPTFTYNVLPDLDIDLVWQSFMAETSDGFDDISHRVFVRIKWSFEIL